MRTSFVEVNKTAFYTHQPGKSRFGVIGTMNYQKINRMSLQKNKDNLHKRLSLKT